MNDCIFCKIINGSIPSRKIFENDSVIGFFDLYPQAKKHYLFIHREHTSDVGEMIRNDSNQIETIFKGIHAFIAHSSEFKNGYRIVTNVGPDAGQSVFHTHFHLLGGMALGQFGA